MSAATTYHFRFHRLRLEYVDIAVEQELSDHGRLVAMLEAHKLARRKKTEWTPMSPEGDWVAAEIVEALKTGVASQAQWHLAREAGKWSHIAARLNREAQKGELLLLGNRIRKSKEEDLSCALDLIEALMEEAGITEIVTTTK